jgi:tRNA(Ile)-lysidine synthase
VDLLQQFKEHIQREKLIARSDKILLAVSGGVDSVAMAELFHQAKINFGIAHCNFSMRRRDSDLDEKFVRLLAKKYDAEFYSMRFDTKQHAKQHKLSLQEAARDLRYDWFATLMEEKKYSCVATAHHLNDNIETFFINLLRGTGIAGLAGIQQKTEDGIIRPLLFASKRDIIQFAKNNQLHYREDSSNKTDDYLRNKIRHHLVPVFQKLNASFEKIMQRNIHHLNFTNVVFMQAMLDETIRMTHGNGLSFFSRKELGKLEMPADHLYEFLSPFGFNGTQVSDIWNCNTSGKAFYSGNFRVLCDRDKIIFVFHREKKNESVQILASMKSLKLEDFTLKISSINLSKQKTFSVAKDPAISLLDKDMLKFPLTLRKWKAGDTFQPLGMKNRKKISDFLVDNKISIPEKELVHVILSGVDIVCILGHRIDERFKITPQSRNVYRIDYLSKLK